MQRVVNINKAMAVSVKENPNQFSNFEMLYFSNPIDEGTVSRTYQPRYYAIWVVQMFYSEIRKSLFVLKDGLFAVVAAWMDQGKEAWELVESFDGFHPNQVKSTYI